VNYVKTTSPRSIHKWQANKSMTRTNLLYQRLLAILQVAIVMYKIAHKDIQSIHAMQHWSKNCYDKIIHLHFGKNATENLVLTIIIITWYYGYNNNWLVSIIIQCISLKYVYKECLPGCELKSLLRQETVEDAVDEVRSWQRDTIGLAKRLEGS